MVDIQLTDPQEVSEESLKETIDTLVTYIVEMRKELDQLRQRRIYQQDIIPDSIKMRAMGEANRYIQFGLEADLPLGFMVGSSTTAYFAYDTNKLYVWNGTVYKSVTLS